jgi:hypothetical protein
MRSRRGQFADKFSFWKSTRASQSKQATTKTQISKDAAVPLSATAPACRRVAGRPGVARATTCKRVVGPAVDVDDAERGHKENKQTNA